MTWNWRKLFLTYYIYPVSRTWLLLGLIILRHFSDKQERDFSNAKILSFWCRKNTNFSKLMSGTKKTFFKTQIGVMENQTQTFCSISLVFFQRFDHGAALKIECKMPHLNIAFDRYASIGTVMYYILVMSIWDMVSKFDLLASTSPGQLCLYAQVNFN